MISRQKANACSPWAPCYLLGPQFNALWGPKPFHSLGGSISFGDLISLGDL